MLGKTYIWTYDKAGNIRSRETYAYTTGALGSAQRTVSYDYSSSSWGDLLTSYWGNSITYDGVGNPLTWGDYGELTWQGRRLMSYSDSESGDDYSYTYNADGIRTSKTVNGVKHTYHLSGTQILSEEWTDRWNRHVMVYIYDAAGQPIGMTHFQDSTLVDTYLYEKNIQGDVVAVYDYAGDLVVRYAYNAWGAVSETEYGSEYCEESFEVLCNPFRYRGYYYDTETDFYYLNSRYYDPAVGRFLNADGYINANGDLIGFNMFAYCSNNPVMGYDPSGESILGALVLLGVVAISALLLTSCGGEQPPHVIASGSADQELIDYLVPGGCEDEVGALNKAIDELTPYLNDSHESGGYIYKRSNGKYYFSGVTQKGATATSCIIDMSGAPSDATIVATIHTHPAAREMGRLIFTAKEWRYVTRHNCTSYVFDVDGHVFALSPSSKDYMDYSQYK